MHYGAALPAGGYRGSLGRYKYDRHYQRGRTSNEGAGLRAVAQRTALSGIGLGALGDNGVDFCRDPGWQIAQGIIGAAGQVIQGAAGSDQGWQTVGQTTQGFSSAWSQVCTAQQQAQGSGNQFDFEQYLAAERAKQDSAIGAEREANEQYLAQLMYMQQMMQQQQAAQQQQGGIDTNTLLIGGGVLAAVVVGALLLT